MRTFAALVLVLVVAGCKPGAAPRDRAALEPPREATTMKLPANVIEDPSITPPPGVDTRPLGSDALVRVQVFSLGDSTRGNWRARLDADGSLYVQHNAKAPDPVPPERYGAPWPASPIEKLAPATVERVRGLIRDHILSLAAGYRTAAGADDGGGRVVDVQLEGRTHRVTVLHAVLPPIAELEEIVLRYP